MNKDSNIYKELTEIEINKILENCFEEKVEFASEIISGGLFNTTYHIKLLNRNDVILRVGPSNKELLLNFEHNLMDSEEIFYNKCKSEGVPCSNIIILDKDNRIINRDYMIVEYINSKPLSEIKISKNIENKIFEEVGTYTKRIHEIEGANFGRVFDVSKGKGFKLWSEYLYNEISEVGEKLVEFNIYSLEEVNLFKALIDKHKNLLDDIKRKSLIHGDLWSGNILVENNDEKYSVVAIIDGDRSLYGDSDFEFANEWITNESFMKGYGRDLNVDIKSKIRRKIYSFIYALIDSYVWYVEYNNEQCGQDNKNKALKLLNELVY